MASYGLLRILNFIDSDSFNFFLALRIGFDILVGILTWVNMAPASPNQ